MNNREEISILDLISILIKRWWITVGLMLVFAIVSFVYYTGFVDAKYTSTGTLYITIDSNYSNQSGDVNIYDIQAAQQLSNTYIEILSSNTFLKTIAVESGLDYSYKELSGIVSYTADDESEIIGIKAVTTVPEYSAIIVSTILNNAQSEISRVVVGGSAKAIDTPEVPTSHSSPNVTKKVMLALLLGFLLGCAINFMIEFFDDSIKGVEDVVEMFEIPVLAEIPLFTNDKDAQDKHKYYYSSRYGYSNYSSYK